MFSIIKIDNCGILKIQNNYSHHLSRAVNTSSARKHLWKPHLLLRRWQGLLSTALAAEWLAWKTGLLAAAWLKQIPGSRLLLQRYMLLLIRLKYFPVNRRWKISNGGSLISVEKPYIEKRQNPMATEGMRNEWARPIFMSGSIEGTHSYISVYVSVATHACVAVLAWLGWVECAGQNNCIPPNVCLIPDL